MSDITPKEQTIIANQFTYTITLAVTTRRLDWIQERFKQVKAQLTADQRQAIVTAGRERRRRIAAGCIRTGTCAAHPQFDKGNQS